MDTPFLHSLIHPTKTPTAPAAYLGIGNSGVRGEPGEFGFTLVLFLWFAEKMRHILSLPAGTVLLNDRFAEQTIDVTAKKEILEKLFALLNMEWRIETLSALDCRLDNLPYEEMQTKATTMLLAGGGYQIGWAYPTTGAGTRDERYFAEYLQANSRRVDIGFALAQLPTIIPTGIHGPPYLVKERDRERRLVLLDKPDVIRKKLSQPNGEMIAMKPGKAEPILAVLKLMGMIDYDARTPRFYRDNRHVELIIEGACRLADRLRAS